MTTLSIDAARLLGRLRNLRQIGRTGDGRLVRMPRVTASAIASEFGK